MDNHIRKTIISLGFPILFVLMMCVFCFMVVSLLLSFLDIMFVRHQIENTIFNIQELLQQDDLVILEDGSLSPAALSFIEQMDVVSKKSIDASSMEVLFGAFSLALISVSLLLLGRANEVSEKAQQKAEEALKKIEDLKIEEAVQKANDAFTKSEQAETKASSVQEKAEGLDQQIPRIQRQADQSQQLLEDLTGKTTSIMPLMSCYENGAKLVRLGQTAYVHVVQINFADKMNKSNDLAYLVRQALKDIETELDSYRQQHGTDPASTDQLYDMIFEIRQIIIALSRLEPKVRMEFDDTCKTLLRKIREPEIISYYRSNKDKLSNENQGKHA